jgi:predicted chitinase
MDYLSKADLLNMGWDSEKLTVEMVTDLNKTLEKYNITSPESIKHFIAQCTKESEHGLYTTELGSDSYFRNNGYDPMYKGAGYIQLTGRDNYEAFSKEVNDSNVIDKGAEYVGAKYPWMSAGFWWEQNRMNDRIDTMVKENKDSSEIVDEVSRIVNAGTGGNLKYVKGLEDRHLYYNQAVENHIGEPKLNLDTKMQIPTGPEKPEYLQKTWPEKYSLSTNNLEKIDGTNNIVAAGQKNEGETVVDIQKSALNIRDLLNNFSQNELSSGRIANEQVSSKGMSRQV